MGFAIVDLEFVEFDIHLLAEGLVKVVDRVAVPIVEAKCFCNPDEYSQGLPTDPIRSVGSSVSAL